MDMTKGRRRHVPTTLFLAKREGMRPLRYLRQQSNVKVHRYEWSYDSPGRIHLAHDTVL